MGPSLSRCTVFGRLNNKGLSCSCQAENEIESNPKDKGLEEDLKREKR